MSKKMITSDDLHDFYTAIRPYLGGTRYLDDLIDVDIDNQTLADGQVPMYDSTSDKWENASLGTAASKDVASSGDASATQVVMGNDSRLTDARSASDVYDWAKASTKPTYTASEVGLGNVGNFKAVSTESNQGLTVAEQSNARTNIGAGTSDFDGAYSSLSGTPTLGTAAAKDVATTGNASATEVVMGNDTRLTDSRPASDVSSWAKASTKPSYSASEVGAVATSALGIANGVAELDENGKVPSSQLPSFVDEVIEGYYDTLSGKFYEEDTYTTEIIGESGKIYIDLLTDKTYRWSGTVFVEISESLALGETSSTAYRGDRGKTAYDHSQTIMGNPHNVTASDVGLGNVGNFKAVSTEAAQGLTDTEKSNARANIGAGTSSFDGAYSSLTGTPTLGTAAEKDVATSGDAGSTQVVMGNDSRLTDARNAADVPAWAKASTKPTYTASEIGLGNVGNFKAVSTEANQNLTSTEQENARANIGAGTSDFSGSYNDLTDKPTIPTVNNATLTIQKNGTNVQTFTANASADKTANITVPTKVSELTNDSGYTTNTGTVTQVKVGTTAYDPSSGVVSLPAYPTVNNATLTIQKNGTNVQTFTANASSNVTANITMTKSDVGLGNVGNFKAVSTVASQGLTDTEKTAARANIGLGTAAVKDVPSSGNASTSQVVMGNDSRLTDARNAADVSAWAKEATKPTYTASEVGLGNVGNFKAVSTEASQGLTEQEKANARANIDVGSAVVDSTLSTTSQNAVQNMVITNELNKAYKDDDTAETYIADGDYVPFYDTSASAKRKSLWSNIIAKIKAALGIASSGTTFLRKDGTWATPTNTTYTFATGDNNGTIKVTPSGDSAQNVSVKGLASGAYIVASKASEANTLVRRAESDSGIDVGRVTCTGGASFTGGATFGSKVIIDVGTVDSNDLQLGSDTTGHHGALIIYGNGSKFAAIKESAVTLGGSRTLSVPNESGTIQVTSSSSRRVKKNIRDMTDEEAKKLLDVNIVKFDYKDDWCGGEKNQSGVIAEDTIKIIPEAVHVPENYDPNEPVDEEYNLPPDVDYRKFIPHLIKLVQIQQAEIDELKNIVQALKEE